MKFLIFASLLTAGAFASKCHPYYECCNNCNLVYKDYEGYWGIENDQWCFFSDDCNTITIENISYPYCSSNNCFVYYSDISGDWGVENDYWCFMRSSCGQNGNVNQNQNPQGNQEQQNNQGQQQNNQGQQQNNQGQQQQNNPEQQHNNQGQQQQNNPEQQHNNQGQQQQNNQGQQQNNQGQQQNNQNVNRYIIKNKVIPVLTLISSSGTSNFATKPVEKHIARQTSNNRNAPEPYYEECDIILEDTDNSKVLDFVKGKAKVRGNWTSNYPKKGLRLNFEKGQSILGLNNGKKLKNWVLLAEYKDGSLLRSKCAFDMSRGILNPDGYYSSDSELVELVINNEYFGVYLLAEHQQINEDRVNITKAKDNYTGTDIGYLLELDEGYSQYEPDLQKFAVTYNNNAPIKPFDGNNGSGKTIQPRSGSVQKSGQQQQQGQQGQQHQGQQQQGQPQQGQQGQQQHQGQQGQPQQGQPQQGQQQQGQPQQGQQQQGQQGQPQQGQQQQGQPQHGQQGQQGPGQPHRKRSPQQRQPQQQPNNNNWNSGGQQNQRSNMVIKNDIFSQDQHDFIASFVNNAYKVMYEAAYNQKAYVFSDDYSYLVESSDISTKEAILNVVEADSLADLYLISELTCDADLYYSSFYLDVDFGANGSKKLRFEAPWDFDSGLGNKERCTNGQGFFAANIIYDNNGMSLNKINPWLAVIMYEDWFQDLIKEKWTRAYSNGVFRNAINTISFETEIASDAFDRNYSKWNNIKNNSAFANELSRGAKQCKSQSDAAKYLSSWLQSRVSFINSYWGN